MSSSIKTENLRCQQGFPTENDSKEGQHHTHLHLKIDELEKLLNAAHKKIIELQSKLG